MKKKMNNFEVMAKACRALESCETYDQFKVASKFALLAWKAIKESDNTAERVSAGILMAKISEETRQKLNNESTKAKRKIKTLIKVKDKIAELYDYDPCMFGMANGLILAVSIITGEDPIFLEPLSNWVVDELE